MVRIDVTILISRPVQEVWDYFIDLRNSPRWTRSGSELRPTTEGTFGVGTTVESVRSIFGREIKSQTLFTTHYEPPQLISFTADVKLLGHLTGGFTFESVDSQTRLSRWTQMDSGGPRGMVGTMLAPVVRKAQSAELASLKRLIEAAAREAPSAPGTISTSPT